VKYTESDVAHRAEVPTHIVRDIFDVIIAAMEEGNRVVIHGFGAFEIVERQSRRIDRDTDKGVKYTLSPTLKQELNDE
jgi:nucleoid DNA-binding protein